MEILIALIGIVLTGFGVYYTRKQTLSPPKVGDEKFQNALSVEKEYTGKIAPEGHILRIWSGEKAVFEIINGDIGDAACEIIVSSDDNRFSASGGVAKVLAGKAGRAVRSELDTLGRTFKWPQGSIGVTRAGKFPARYLFHPVVIDHKRNLYPSLDVIRAITRRCLEMADAVGADSIAMPVFGGGTAARASEKVTTPESVAAICEVTIAFLTGKERHGGSLEYVSLYVYDKSTLPEDLIEDKEKALPDAMADAPVS